MDAIDFETIGARTDAERTRLVAGLRQLAEKLEKLPPADAIEALAMLPGAVDELFCRPEPVLRLGGVTSQ